MFTILIKYVTFRALQGLSSDPSHMSAKFSVPWRWFCSSMQFQERMACKSGQEVARLSQYSPVHLLSTCPSALPLTGISLYLTLGQLQFSFTSPLFPPVLEIPPALAFLAVVWQPQDQAQTTLLNKGSYFTKSAITHPRHLLHVFCSIQCCPMGAWLWLTFQEGQSFIVQKYSVHSSRFNSPGSCPLHACGTHLQILWQLKHAPHVSKHSELPPFQLTTSYWSFIPQVLSWATWSCFCYSPRR